MFEENQLTNTSTSESLTYYSVEPSKSYYQKDFENYLTINNKPLSEKAILEYLESIRKSKTTGRLKKNSTFEFILRSIEEMINLNVDLKESQKIKLHKAIEQLQKKYKVVKKEKSVKREETLSHEEIKSLIDGLKNLSAGEPDRAGNKDLKKYQKLSLIVESLYWSGCRISELINCKVEDCRKTENGKFYILTVIGKGNKERTSPILSVNLYNRILSLFQSKEYLFESTTHTQLNRHNVFRDISRAGEVILGKKIYNHIFRHSRATHIYDKTKDVKLVQTYLGHSSAKTTMDMYVFMDIESKLDELDI